MRRWFSVAATAGTAVGDRPDTWLAGALAWLATVGWLPLVVGVAQPPTESDLTFLSARIFGSAIWPWNIVLIAVGLAAIASVASTLAAVAESALLDAIGPARRGLGLTWRFLTIGSVLAVPTAIALLVLGIALVQIAPDEFTSPDRGAGPIVRTLARVAPLLALFAVVAAAGSAVAAAAVRLVHDRGDDVATALAASPRLLASAGAPAILHLVAVIVARVGTIALAALLLRVLWAPVGELLAVGDRGALTIGLLVGFVAIWICLVLAAGALHAWASAGWSVLLSGPATGRGSDRRHQESPIDR